MNRKQVLALLGGGVAIAFFAAMLALPFVWPSPVDDEHHTIPMPG